MQIAALITVVAGDLINNSRVITSYKKIHNSSNLLEVTDQLQSKTFY